MADKPDILRVRLQPARRAHDAKLQEALERFGRGRLEAAKTLMLLGLQTLQRQNSIPSRSPVARELMELLVALERQNAGNRERPAATTVVEKRPPAVSSKREDPAEGRVATRPADSKPPPAAGAPRFGAEPVSDLLGKGSAPVAEAAEESSGLAGWDRELDLEPKKRAARSRLSGMFPDTTAY